MDKMQQISREGFWSAQVSDTTLRSRRGHAVVNEHDAQLLFVEEPPRTVRSKELAATPHGRMRIRDDDSYYLSFRFKMDEKFIQEELLAELRRLVREEKERLKRTTKQTKTTSKTTKS